MPLKGLQTSQTLRAVLRVKLEQRAVYSVFVFKFFFFVNVVSSNLIPKAINIKSYVIAQLHFLHD